MLRPICSLPLSQHLISHLREFGIVYVEDTYNEAELPNSCQEAVKYIHELCRIPPCLSALDVWQEELQGNKISTLSVDLDNILDGGFQCRMVTELFGGPGSGKTQIWYTSEPSLMIEYFDETCKLICSIDRKFADVHQYST